MGDREFLSEQIAYYRARAPEYDEWMLRQGRYDHGAEHRQRWFEELAMLEAALAAASPGGDVLELACGTGIWTRRLVTAAARLTAVDASPEMIAINRAKVGGGVTYVEANLFEWEPSSTYDFIFFGFWLSHVPDDRFDGFWAMLRRALRPGGTVFFVDNGDAPEGTAWDQTVESGGLVDRRLNDGRTFRIVKVFHQPDPLASRLRALGWDADVRATPHFFLHGTARLPHNCLPSPAVRGGRG
jgi:demethylmenaquinone methyltransferase/2-methoxy-6-polyprenyl-1,4-benzoquinol methylase